MSLRLEVAQLTAEQMTEYRNCEKKCGEKNTTRKLEKRFQRRSNMHGRAVPRLSDMREADNKFLQKLEMLNLCKTSKFKLSAFYVFWFPYRNVL